MYNHTTAYLRFALVQKSSLSIWHSCAAGVRRGKVLRIVVWPGEKAAKTPLGHLDKKYMSPVR